MDNSKNGLVSTKQATVILLPRKYILIKTKVPAPMDTLTKFLFLWEETEPSDRT